jgi:hypothetical protein
VRVRKIGVVGDRRVRFRDLRVKLRLSEIDLTLHDMGHRGCSDKTRETAMSARSILSVRSTPG